MQKKFAQMATKIPFPFKEKINSIAKKLGMSNYQLLQSMIYMFIRFFDTPTQIDDDTYKLIEAYLDTLRSVNDSYNPLSIKDESKQTIRKAIFFVEENHNAQLIEVCINNDGKIMGSYNIDSILEDVLSVMDPNIIRMLKIEKEKKDHNSMLMNLKEIIKCAINNDPSTSIEEEIKSLFDDVRIGSGEKINDGIYYKGKHNKTKVPIIETRRNKRSDI